MVAVVVTANFVYFFKLFAEIEQCAQSVTEQPTFLRLDLEIRFREPKTMRLS